jgi:uncharacterized membrane protein
MKMGYAEAIETIDAPVGMVWDTFNDIDHTPEWVMGLNRAELITTEPYGVGSSYNDYNQLGRTIQLTNWHITEFEHYTRQVHVSDSITLPSKMTIVFAPRAESTRVKMSVEYRFVPRLGIISRAFEALVMNRVLSSVLRRNLKGLNAYLGVKPLPYRNVDIEYDKRAITKVLATGEMASFR